MADPEKIIRELAQLRDLKSFPSADAVNTTTSPQLPKYVSAAFGSLELNEFSPPPGLLTSFQTLVGFGIEQLNDLSPLA